VHRYEGSAAGRAGGDRVCSDARPDTTPHRRPSIADAATRAPWGAPLGTQRPRAIALIAWRPLVKGALRGLATVELPIGLKLIDCPVLVSNGKAWASLPSKPVLDRDGRHKTDANGKGTYVAMLDWRSRELSERFSQAVVTAIRQLCPGALGEADHDHA
jgi:hypothetical protein